MLVGSYGVHRLHDDRGVALSPAPVEEGEAFVSGVDGPRVGAWVGSFEGSLCSGGLGLGDVVEGCG